MIIDIEAAYEALTLRADGIPKPGTPAYARLWGRCIESPQGCWEFQGHRNKDGYGTLRFEGRMEKAHRVAWVLASGPIPAGMQICHRCDNPCCCNPKHLFVGTNADNMRDRQAKGRTKNLVTGRALRRARAAAITHCPQGHPYAGANLRLRPGGGRRCAQCYRDRSRSRREVIHHA
jgi:hypothetical protein